MKHQSFYNEYSAIAAKEIEELRRCLKEHGGSFSWQDNVKVDEPIITVGLDKTGWVGDVRILKIWIEKNGSIRLIGVQNNSGCEVEFNLDEVHYSHIEFIMDYMPEPDSQPKSEEEKSYTYKEMENAVHLAADLAEDIAKIEKSGSYPWLDSRDKAAYFIKKAVEFEKRLGGKDEDEGNYDYIEELEKFEKEVMNEIIDDIPLPF